MIKTKRAKIILFTAVALLLIGLTLASLLFFGVIHLNNPDPQKYPVRGIDLSSYQGEVDWEVLSGQGIKFAFIKATEGSSFVDRMFKQNWSSAAETDLRIGAYHFFSFESSGERQAELFCNTVDAVDNMLPPVIDVEYYGNFRSEKDIDVAAIKRELRSLINVLTDKYGMKPIIYADSATYKTIVRDDFADCDLWYRSVYFSVPSDISWKFWQYSNRHVLKGYSGEERYIDMNVFYGDVEAFENYPD